MLRNLFGAVTVAGLTAIIACAGCANADATKTADAGTPNTIDMAAKGHAAKLIDVKVCPITGEAVQGNGSGNEVVGKYRVFFCCDGCQPEFDKLPKAQKEKKIAELLKKQSAKSKKA